MIEALMFIYSGFGFFLGVVVAMASWLVIACILLLLSRVSFDDSKYLHATGWLILFINYVLLTLSVLKYLN